MSVGKEGAMGAAYIIGFAHALKKLREAEQAGTAARLDAKEVKAVMMSFRLLREGRAK